MYRFQTRENIDQRREVCFARPVPDDEVAWDSSLDLLWQLDRQVNSPRKAATTSTDSFRAKPPAQIQTPQIAARPISCTEAPKPGPTQQDCVRAEPLRQPLKELKADFEPLYPQAQGHAAACGQGTDSMQYSKNQQLALEAEARMLQALAHSDAAQHLATPLLLNAAQTAAIRDDPSMVLPDYLVKILATPIHISASIYVTSTQMSNLSLADLKQLYTVLVCRMRDRLVVYQSDDRDQSAWADVEQLCIQACTLMIRQLKHNLSHCTYLFYSGVGGEPLVGYKPTDDCSTLVTLLDCSDSQTADLLMLRQLFFTRLAHLASVRRDSLQNVTRCAMLGKMEDAEQDAARLRTVVAASYHTYLQYSAALLFGMNSSRQLAVGLVYSFPQIFGTKAVEALAKFKGAPSFASIMDLEVPKPAEYCWEDITEYLKSITSQNIHDYVPFMSSMKHSYSDSADHCSTK